MNAQTETDLFLLRDMKINTFFSGNEYHIKHFLNCRWAAFFQIETLNIDITLLQCYEWQLYGRQLIHSVFLD